MTALATTLQAFFTDRLVRQRQVSPNTLCTTKSSFLRGARRFSHAAFRS